jgi:hypothetical protein
MFDNIKPIDPKAERRKKRLLIGIPIVAIVVGFLYYEFKNFPEEHAASRFLQAVEKQDYQLAYQLWKPGKFYSFGSFNQDWGPGGVEGPIHDYKITNSHARGSGVVVEIQLNGDKRISLWVEKSDKSLSFPP